MSAGAVQPPLNSLLRLRDGGTDSYSFAVTADMLSRAGGPVDSSPLETTTPAPTYYSRANVTLTGKIATGDLWTVTLDGRDYQYQVKATDADIIAMPTAAILLTALVATLPAVLRALRTDPTQVLRTE